MARILEQFLGVVVSVRYGNISIMLYTACHFVTDISILTPTHVPFNLINICIRHSLTMANYSVDDEIAAFFDKTTTTRDACDAFAIGLGGCPTPVDIQGVCSYTVYAGPRSELAVQFRLKSLKLSLEISHIARSIHGDFVPRVEYRGQAGEDSVAEDEQVAATKRRDSKPRKAREALFIYVMDRIPGITYLDFVLSHSAEVPEASPGFAQWRMNLTIGVAK